METTSQTKKMMDYLFDRGELKTIESKPRRSVKMPVLDSLKPQQKEAYDKLIDFLMSNHGGEALLKGYAGTGKTYLSSRLVESVLYQRSVKIAVTAPTNKAVKVLYKTSDYKHPNLDFMTIHKLLGLKERIDAYGNQKFVQDKNQESKIEEYDILVLDEVSMLNDDLYDMLQPYVTMGLKIMYMGDPVQIPPVGRESCKPFDSKVQEFNEILVVELTDIVRQAKGNPIIDATLKVRKVIQRPKVFVKRDSKFTEQGLLAFLDQREQLPLVNKLLDYYFNCDYFEQDADFAKVIAWTNATVDSLNNKIRKMIYGRDLSKLMVGEKLIADAPVFETGPSGELSILLNTNDELEVLSFDVKTEDINGGDFSLDYYSTMVEYINPDGNRVKHRIKIIHEDSEDDLKNIQKQLADIAKAQPRGSYKAAGAWKDFYMFDRHFAKVKYNYAITAHKSQGSTYQNVFVMESDMDKNRKVYEKNRIKYTALSRPSDKLFVIS